MDLERMQQMFYGLFDELTNMEADDRDNCGLYEAEDIEGATVQTFFEAGLLTSDAGIVLRLEDGNEFQLTIVHSRSAP